MKSLDVVLPVFNRDPQIVEYVTNQFLEQGVDHVILVNVGKKELGLATNKIIEIYNPMSVFLPGWVRNAGADVSRADVVIHSGADILVLKGDINVFRTLEDKEIMHGGKCYILTKQETSLALTGARDFTSAHCSEKNTGALLGLTRKSIFFDGMIFDLMMRCWGWVDIDLCKRAKADGFTERWAGVDTAHLFHKGGSTAFFFGRAFQDFNYWRNKDLMLSKSAHSGWWGDKQDDLAALLVEYATSKLSQGRDMLAASALRVALEIKPDHAFAAYHLGSVYERCKLQKLACEFFAKAECDPYLCAGANYHIALNSLYMPLVALRHLSACLDKCKTHKAARRLLKQVVKEIKREQSKK